MPTLWKRHKTMIPNKYILQFIACIYVIFAISIFFPIAKFGIVPRSATGLIGIFTSPFLHTGIRHLVSNTIPLIVLLIILNYFYHQKAMAVIAFTIIIGGFFVWIFARNANHIGASGLIYGLAAFLITNGFIEQKFLPMLISIGVIILYGGMIWGVFPNTYRQVSWESHLFGTI
ncbi:MAG: membrane associated rhomboid family serine protease, partial [bacterium]